jgi:uncharacterized protein
MKYNKLGNDIIISEVSFGCIPMLSGAIDIMPRHFNLSLKDSNALLDAAYDFGINFYDTAIKEEYGDTEYKLQSAFKNKRDKIVISSKARKYSYLGMKKAIESSLKELGTEYIDIYGIHQISPDNYIHSVDTTSGALKALIEAKKEGKIRMISVGTHFAETAAMCSKISEIEMIQLPYNPLEYGLFNTSLGNGLDISKTIFHKIYGGGLLPSILELSDLIKYALEPKPASVLIGIGTIHEFKQFIHAYNQKDKVNDKIVIPFSECNRCQKCNCNYGVNISLILRFRTYAMNGFHRWAEKGFKENYKKKCISCNECLVLCPQKVDIPLLIKETELYFNQLNNYKENLK